jgi:hypothetical protein
MYKVNSRMPIMVEASRIREIVSYKQHEDYIRDIRDRLCLHYRLNKSDLVKYLIRKEEHVLSLNTGTFQLP